MTAADRAATILLLSTADTDLLAARTADAGYRVANPIRLPVAAGAGAWSARAVGRRRRGDHDGTGGGWDGGRHRRRRWGRGCLGRRCPCRPRRAGGTGAVSDDPRATWAASAAALSPMDAAMQVAIPEFDGRVVTVPFSFKEPDPRAAGAAGDGGDGGGVPVYVADPERTARVAGIAARLARLRYVPNRDKRVALVLSSYPTKHARVGNAVGLDTPASAVRLLRAMRDAGYDLGDLAATLDDLAGDDLIHALIAAGGHDVEWLTEEQLAAAPPRLPLRRYRRWFDSLPAELADRMREHWGEPPGALYVHGDGDDAEIVLAALRFGNVLLMIQPPRGFGENPVAIYHDPDLPPSHHYLAAYRCRTRRGRAGDPAGRAGLGRPGGCAAGVARGAGQLVRADRAGPAGRAGRGGGRSGRTGPGGRHRPGAGPAGPARDRQGPAAGERGRRPAARPGPVAAAVAGRRWLGPVRGARRARRHRARPAATSTPSTRRRSRPGWPGTSAGRWPTRCWPGTAPTPGTGPARSG